MFFVFGREEKSSKFVQAEHRTKGISIFFFFGSRECLDLVVIAWLIKPWFVS